MRTQHFNIFNTGTESFFTPGTQLANIAAVKPDAPAVIYVSPENKESVMTWRELHELSNRIAWYLLGQGVGPGKSVLAALPNIPTHIALAFGIWKTGACYVPVSNRAPQRNLMEICACVSPALVITNRKKPDGYPGLSTAELRTLCANCPADMPPDVLAIPNLANCSGGTTGKTKVIEQDMPAGESDEGLRTWFAVSGMRFEMRQLLAGRCFTARRTRRPSTASTAATRSSCRPSSTPRRSCGSSKSTASSMSRWCRRSCSASAACPASGRKTLRASRCFAIPAASARRISSASGFRSSRPSGSTRCTP